jgi:uncharacterized protein YcsI (UPF0317 family)
MSADYAQMTGRQIRQLCRAARFDRPTAGVARGFAQANLVILPGDLGERFREFCRLNPKPCPLLEVTRPGSYEAAELAPGSDLRTDLPRYRVYVDGVCVDRPTDIMVHWPDTSRAFVAFLVGCSFTFERALVDAGVPVRHVALGCNVPMYRTNVACAPAGPFHGPLVVSMRPMTPELARVAERVTSRCPRVHGPPVQIGHAEALGIADLSVPDYGDPVPVHDGEVPVFWACGVTPMEAIIRAKPALAITHEPGHMLVTDVSDRSLFEGPVGTPS